MSTVNKPVEEGEIGRATLEVYECTCGFYLGLDASYLEQVGPVTVPCPNCDAPIQSYSEPLDRSET